MSSLAAYGMSIFLMVAVSHALHLYILLNLNVMELSKLINRIIEDKNVIKLVQRATIFAFFAPCSSSLQVQKIIIAPNNGKKVKNESNGNWLIIILKTKIQK